MKYLKSLFASSLAIALSILSSPAIAGDPFRTENPRAIDDQTEAVFRAMFQEGNYTKAQQLLNEGDANDPMAYAIRSAFAFMDDDLNALSENAALTLSSAEDLVASDPLRGNLYIAVGHFLEGAYALLNNGTVRGTPTALQKLQLVFNHMSEAEKIDPADPELNLIKGYMDLMLAVNLPFADPAQAIQRFENYAAPDYLAQRGVAIAYRDLDEHGQAMDAIERAIAAAPENPELFYLKAQILVQQEKDQESLEFFDQALERHSQLPDNSVEQILWERCRAQSRAESEERNCNREVDKWMDEQR
jgi:tetratricopeptide (TPR) repeat protein